LKLIKHAEDIITKASDNGKKTFQPNRINWSYRYRGNVVRTQTKLNKRNNSFKDNQNNAGNKLKKITFI